MNWLYHLPRERRGQTAATLREYRAYIAENPCCELSPLLAECVTDLHCSLHARRERNRLIGFEIKS